jgi:hypothetical protein
LLRVKAAATATELGLKTTLTTKAAYPQRTSSTKGSPYLFTAGKFSVRHAVPHLIINTA